MNVDLSKVITAEDKAIAAAEAERSRLVITAVNYLRDTDWMVIREAEGVKPMPDDVRDRRAQARQTLSGS